MIPGGREWPQNTPFTLFNNYKKFKKIHLALIPPVGFGTYVRPPRPVCLQFVTIFQFSHIQPSQWPLENRNCRKNRSFKQIILFQKLRFLSIFQFSSVLPAVDMRKLKFSLKIGVSITKLCDVGYKQGSRWTVRQKVFGLFDVRVKIYSWTIISLRDYDWIRVT